MRQGAGHTGGPKTIDRSSPRPALRLVPLAAVLPKLRPPRAPRPVPGTDPDRRRAAESLVELCAQVLRGRHPLAAVQRRSDRIAYRQFSELYHRFRPTRQPSRPVSLRLRHSGVDASGGLSMVAILSTGDLVRAMSLRADQTAGTGWRLTQCRLIEP